MEKKEGRRLTLGESVMNTKNAYNGVEKMSFILIGDPALTLAYPEYRMQVTEINGQAVSETSEPAHFKALERITISGHVNDLNGALASNFSGQLFATVLDCQQTITTLNNNNNEETFTYTDYPNTIYIGNDSVRSGTFSFSFTVPKDISYSNDFGKLNLYASCANSANEAQGAFNNFRVGGTAEDAENDSDGPEISSLYLNDTSFSDGAQVNSTPFVVTTSWVESEINLRGSLFRLATSRI